ncbi:hypothetical protein CM49_00076 [Paenibacillus sp. P1XP2]|nr:hypothetical protein CM49_00076 [Paenibacillus sp. P1XP2]
MDDKTHVVLEKRRFVELRMFPANAADDGDVRFVMEQELERPGGVGRRPFQLHGGVPFFKFRNELGSKKLAGKYVAERCNLPSLPSFIPSRRSSIDRSRSNSLCASEASIRPASVKATPRPWGIHSRMPSSCSSLLICAVTAGWLTRSNSEASVTLPVSATLLKNLRACKFIGVPVLSCSLGGRFITKYYENVNIIY